MVFEAIKFIFYSVLIVFISKYILVETLRKLAESLNLKPKTVGNIAGISTSVPELLTITTSSLRGLTGASIFNILSSNIINLIQYFATLIFNKNISKLKNNAIKTDLILVMVTIILPILMIRFGIELDVFIVPLFVILYVFFVFLNNNAHNLYLKMEEEKKEKLQVEKNLKQIVKYVFILLITGFLLYFVGNLLGNTLENLCNIFHISEMLVGSLLGFITSIPELITFFESQQYNNKVNDEMDGVVEATNNLLTSNILNLFIIQTIGILLSSI